jgi:hypothetical protein
MGILTGLIGFLADFFNNPVMQKIIIILAITGVLLIGFGIQYSITEHFNPLSWLINQITSFF